MKIDVISKVNEVRQEDLKNKTVIVIDVLRASSTIVTALSKGCEKIKPVETIGQAKQYKNTEYILAGERYGKKVQGFSLHNSPSQIMEEGSLSNHPLILTTTNGTRAIQKALKAENTLIGCFLNGTECAKTALKFKRDITILCAGSRDCFAMEDGLAAGFMVREMVNKFPETQINDLGKVMYYAFLAAKDDVFSRLLQSTTGKRLVHMGFTNDIKFCSKLNLIPLAPMIKKEHIIQFSES